MQVGRLYRSVLLGAIALGSWLHPLGTAAQTSPRTLSLGIQAGAGDGPSVVGAGTLEAGVDLSRFLSLRAEFHRWTGGFGVACNQSWPASYECDVGGDALLIGGRGTVRRAWASPFLEVKSGVHFRDDIGDETETGVPIQLKLGLEKSLGSRWYVGLSGSYVRVSDKAYEERMGEGLSYRFIQLGIGLRVSP